VGRSRAKARRAVYRVDIVETGDSLDPDQRARPKYGLWGFDWFNVCQTPGVSAVTTAIRDENDRSFALSDRGKLVAVVSDSMRVLGDGDSTPPGGLGVMEGKAFLMKYLGGVDAVAHCVDSRGADGMACALLVTDFATKVSVDGGEFADTPIAMRPATRALSVLPQGAAKAIDLTGAAGGEHTLRPGRLCGFRKARVLIGEKHEYPYLDERPAGHKSGHRRRRYGRNPGPCRARSRGA
jgi:hypothetical protein